MYPQTRQSGIPIDEIAGEIIQRLTADFGGRVSADGEFWQGGRCPACGKKSLWTLAEKPLQPACNHQAKCGHEFKTRDRWPELFTNISERYQPTPAAPNATADAYLRMMRGFDISTLKGWYDQGNWWKAGADRGTATVRFWLDKEQGIGWQKFVDKVTVTQDGEKTERDSSFIGAFQGMVWTPPALLVEVGKPVYIVEGIFDAIALYLNGYKSVVAIMTCGNFPEKLVEAYRNAGAIWTLALDNDAAGRKHTLKHIERLKQMGQQWDCIQPSQYDSKIDWNDLHIKGRLTKKDMEAYAYYGKLLTAASPEESALATWRYTNKNFFVLTHKQQMWVFKFDIKKFNDEVEEIRAREKLEDGEPLSDDLRDEAMQNAKTITKLSNCNIEFVYTENNPVDNQRYYTFRVEFPDGRVNVDTMTGTQVAGAGDFRKKLLDMASWAKFKGDADAFEWLTEKWSHNVSHIDTVAYAGYVPDANAYVYPAFGIKNGHIVKRNQDNYIRFGDRNIKSAYHDLHIEPNFDLTQYREDWVDDLFMAWKHTGIILLAYFTASLLTAQVRKVQKDFMFLELVGEAGTGKSTLIEFMWRLMGRPGGWEGFDPSASSQSYIGRSLASVSNMPTVFIESDREDGKRGKYKAFDYEEIKKMFGGKSPFNRGVATAGNETYAPPYLGSLVIAQNAPVDASEAVLTRLIHIFTRRSDTSQQTFEAARRIEALKLEQVSGYLIKCLTKSDELLEMFLAEQKAWEPRIRALPHAKTTRISFLHSQLCAAVACLRLVTPIEEDMIDEVQQHIAHTMSAEREQAIKRDHIYVEQLMRVVAYLEEEGKHIDHYKGPDDNIMAIRLGDVYELARKFGQELPAEIDMTKVLKSSRRYVKHNHATASGLTGKTIRCWWLKKTI